MEVDLHELKLEDNRSLDTQLGISTTGCSIKLNRAGSDLLHDGRLNMEHGWSSRPLGVVFLKHRVKANKMIEARCMEL